MQRLQQVVAGKSNPTSNAVSSGSFRGSRYIVYASKAVCHVYRADFTIVQTLTLAVHDANGDVGAVHMEDGGGRIAIVCGSDVSLFVPSGDDMQVQWSLETTLHQEDVVRSLAWSPRGELLTAAEKLSMWRQSAASSEGDEHKEWALAWDVKLSAPATRIEISSDGSFFASYGEDDRLVKVWYRRSAGERVEGPTKLPAYDFAYLPHPQKVMSAQWRKVAKKRTNTEDNVLMTLCQDNICRLWSPISSTQPFQFHLVAVIDPIDFPLTEDHTKHSSSHICTVHWLDSEQIYRAIHFRDLEEDRFSRKNNRRKPGATLMKSRKLKEALKEYPDMLFHVQSDGSMVVWGIQHLTGRPRRVAKVIVVMKMEATVVPQDHEYFGGKVICYHNGYSAKRSSIFFPAELQLLAQRGDGALQMYTMNLDDFFATSWTIPHLAVRHSWTGPRDTPAKFYRHPNENLIALVAEQGEILIYRTYVPQVGLRIKDGLTAVTSFPAYTGSSGSRLVAWLPCGAHMVLQEEQGLALHRIKAPHSRMVTLLDGYDPSDPLLLLHAFHDPDDATRNKIFLIGITKAQRVYLWGFEFQDQTLRLCSLISNSTLSHSITHALPSDDLCAVHYPEAPLGAHVFMTLSNEDRVARFWHAKNGRLASIGEASGSLWEIVAEFGIGDDVVEKVEADAFGKLAVVSVTNGSRQLAVWSNEATGLEMRQEWSMPISDEVVALDWYISSDGQHLLAVAFARRAYVYSQQRLRTVEDVPLWTVVSEFEVSWTESISAISWLTNGSLAIATGQKILVHEKWLSQDKLLNSSILPANSSTTQRDPSHIFSLVDQKNGRMPDHHPQLLVQHLLWGKFEFVKYSLSLLYHFVKRMVDAGRTIKATPMPLWRIFSEDQVIPQGAQQYEGLFDFGDELVEKEVKMGEFGEAQATWLSEQLTRISLPDITNIEQMALLAVIDTLIQIESQKRSLDENGIRYVLFTRLFLFARKTFPAQDKPESLTSRDSAWAFFSESQDNLLDFVTQAHDNKLTWSDAKALGIGYWLRSPDTFRRTMETIARNQYMGLNDTRNPVDCSLLYMALKKKNVVLGLWKLAGSHPEQAAMLRFLANNFEEDRWKSAALKNAFALLGKQRYEYATAFFLLADKLKDAMNVCLKQLRDPQLAIVICRLYEGENGPVQLDTITNVILPQALENGDRWLASMLFTMMKQRDNALLATLSALEGLIPEANPEDTASVTKIKCRLYSDPALLVLYHHLRRSYRAMRVPQCRVSPDLECEFVYGSAQAYERLGCPGLALDILQKAETMIGLYVDDEAPAQPNVKPPSDDIAAGVLDMDSFGKTSSSISKSSAPQASGAFDWGEPASVVTKKEEESSGGMDWGEPVSTQKPATSNSAIMDWGEPVSQQPPPQPGSGGMDWGEPVSQQPPPQPASGGMDWGEPVSQQKPKAETMDWGEPVSKTSAGESSGGIDWGEPISGGGAKKDVLDDEFEAFKKSMGGYAAEDEEDLDMSEDDEEDAKATTQTGLSDSNGVLSTPIKSGAAPILDERTRFRCELEKRNIRLYKWILAMRIVQAVYKSITAVAQNQDILKSEITFLDYFTLIREGIHSLCDIVGMPLQVMDRILDSRCREMEALVPQVELLPLHGTLSESRKAVEEFVVEECNTLTRLGLQEGLSTDDFPYVETLARDILWFLARWHLRVGTEGQSGAELDPSIVGQAAATAFVTWTLCAVRMRKFQTLYWLIGNADQLFSALLENKMDTLKDILLDLLSDRPVEGRPGADPDAEFDDRAGHDSEPEEEDFVTPDPMWSLGDSMLMADSLTLTISLQHVGMALDNYIAQLRDGSSGPVCSADDMHGFLTDAVLRKVSTMLYTMQLDVAKQWKKGPVKIEKLRKFISDLDEKLVWDLLRRTVSVSKMLDFILQSRDEDTKVAKSSRTDLGTGEGEEPAEPKAKPQPELVYKTKDIIHTMAINALDHNNMAVGLHRGIQELDLEHSLCFYQRNGNSESAEASRARKSIDTLQSPISPSENRSLLFEALVGKSASVKKQDTMARNLSFDSMQKALQQNMQRLRRESVSHLELDSGQRISHDVPGVSSLASHPTLNYYLAGINEGSAQNSTVNLYQFGQPKDLVTYTSNTTSRFTRVRFDPFGARFGASDTKGDLHLWRFDASAQALAPALRWECHSVTNDFLFWDSSSLIATAGTSTNHTNVRLWDALLPTHKARIKSFSIAEGGAYSLIYSARHQRLFAGGKKGDIYVIDTRQRVVVDNFHAHEQTVKSLAIDDENDCLISGSTGGDVKVWSLDTFKEMESWTSAHNLPDRHRHGKSHHAASPSGSHIPPLPSSSPSMSEGRQTSLPHSASTGGYTGGGLAGVLSGASGLGGSGHGSGPHGDRVGLSYGVMQVEVVDGRAFTCGADGCVRQYPSIGTLELS